MLGTLDSQLAVYPLSYLPLLAAGPVTRGFLTSTTTAPSLTLTESYGEFDGAQSATLSSTTSRATLAIGVS